MGKRFFASVDNEIITNPRKVRELEPLLTLMLAQISEINFKKDRATYAVTPYCILSDFAPKIEKDVFYYADLLQRNMNYWRGHKQTELLELSNSQLKLALLTDFYGHAQSIWYQKNFLGDMRHVIPSEHGIELSEYMKQLFNTISHALGKNIPIIAADNPLDFNIAINQFLMTSVKEKFGMQGLLQFHLQNGITYLRHYQQIKCSKAKKEIRERTVYFCEKWKKLLMNQREGFERDAIDIPELDPAYIEEMIAEILSENEFCNEMSISVKEHQGKDKFLGSAYKLLTKNKHTYEDLAHYQSVLRELENTIKVNYPDYSDRFISAAVVANSEEDEAGIGRRKSMSAASSMIN